MAILGVNNQFIEYHVITMLLKQRRGSLIKINVKNGSTYQKIKKRVRYYCAVLT